MTKPKSSLKTNLAYGLMVVVPLAVVVLLLAKLVEMLQLVAVSMKLESVFGAGLAVVSAFVVLLLVCLLLGAMVRTRLGSWSFEKIERMILQRVPGYELIGNILKGFATDKDAYPAVMVQLHGPGTAVFGLVMEEHGNGALTVFLPSAPALTVGNLCVVDRDRVTFLDASTADVANCISQWGTGAAKVIGERRP
ncbi:MAG: DUF502 domain-containing protein [Gammaproteobacteria bacterium]|nr:DUF502 domain-containing protein [Gammaproteobacteria bacterium]NIM73129.1 DUF502 domain-containing protein [Gammaproteobacteria bacterium]NIN38809.1 DUF502 domain-containing protein [Gammaproteobacteria bacterium]NIO24884.1 DUF502 domain-containing protein [Gammaproteobacteria bacterium]NIO65486.1 DUF502 domain-containing protein [Gammaproteobacteria bacterium]